MYFCHNFSIFMLFAFSFSALFLSDMVLHSLPVEPLCSTKKDQFNPANLSIDLPLQGCCSQQVRLRVVFTGVTVGDSSQKFQQDYFIKKLRPRVPRFSPAAGVNAPWQTVKPWLIWPKPWKIATDLRRSPANFTEEL